jgi:hypothetical protein
MMIIWSVVSAALIVWFTEADDGWSADWQRDDADRCACCRHDLVAHEHADPRTDCSQCPCPGFRPAG